MSSWSCCVWISVLLASQGIGAAQKAPGPKDRAEATKIIGDARRIVNPRGLQAVEKVYIGGIEQIVSIRSQDLRNPVLIYFHGGPGYVEMPLDWWYDRGWDEYFTVVQWDQRNSGKTYVASGAQPPALLTPERFQKDAVELVQWARKRFGKRKVFVLGHSWGSMLGLKLAAAHPEWLHAYVGMGQITDSPESEREGWAWALARANAEHNAKAISDLKSIAPYAERGKPITVEAILKQRQWLNYYGGLAWRHNGADFEGSLLNLSPEYTDEDVREAFQGQPAVTKALLPPMLMTDLSNIKMLKVPLILLLGRHDHAVSSAVAANWFKTVHAPSKKIVWFENSAHLITTEEPGKLLLSLVNDVRPIAAKAGDVAP